MVMEQRYGAERMRKFLKYELDNYLRGPCGESLEELPLKAVESGQGYVHYRKGSVVMYRLKDEIGADAVNRLCAITSPKPNIKCRHTRYPRSSSASCAP